MNLSNFPASVLHAQHALRMDNFGRKYDVHQTTPGTHLETREPNGPDSTRGMQAPNRPIRIEADGD